MWKHWSQGRSRTQSESVVTLVLGDGHGSVSCTQCLGQGGEGPGRVVDAAWYPPDCTCCFWASHLCPSWLLALLMDWEIYSFWLLLYNLSPAGLFFFWKFSPIILRRYDSGRRQRVDSPGQGLENQWQGSWGMLLYGEEALGSYRR